MPKDNKPSRGKPLNEDIERRGKNSTSDDHIRHSDRLPYKNTIKHDTEPSKNEEVFKKK